MGDRRELLSPDRTHREDPRHRPSEPSPTRRQLEVPVRRLQRNRRSERPELLAVLDALIHPVAHLHRAGRGKDAAIPERPRTELGPALHPSHDVAAGELVRHPFDQRASSIEPMDRSGRPRPPPAPAPDRPPPGPSRDGRARLDPAGRIRSDQAQRAAPSAQPASPGAEGTKTRSNPASRRIRALAQPLSATPPPRQRSVQPVSR